MKLTDRQMQEQSRRTVDACLAYWRTSRQEVLKCAFLIREDCQGGSPIAMREVVVQAQRATDPHRMLDRALSILQHLPDNEREARVMECYAFGQIRGRPPATVCRFWERVSGRAIIDMAPLTAALIGQ